MTTAGRRAWAKAVAAAADHAPPDLESLWRALDAVPDPEVPAISVVELGIVRAVEWEGGESPTLVVRVTPTYSGCPAHEVIVKSIRKALTAAGVARIRVETQLSPPWTTDWIAPAARDKLRRYGIAPPNPGAPVPIRFRASEPVRCPRCGSERTSVLSQFGSTACKAQYRCDACLEPFDYFKPH
jgi:ring-1,2-phenylacetyl-CoA epoxidase subunit PaaD